MYTLKYFERQDLIMGTIISQRLSGKDAEKAAKAVVNEMKKIEEIASFFGSNSQLSNINISSGHDAIKVSRNIIEILLKAKIYGKLVKGAFDVTVAPIVKSWGIFTPMQKVPSSNEIEQLLSLVNYNDIEIDEEKSTVKLKREGQMIDLGGIAKGYAGDKAIEIYKEYNIDSAFINLGGNVVTLGGKIDGEY